MSVLILTLTSTWIIIQEVDYATSNWGKEGNMVDRFERFSVMLAEISRCWHKIATEEMEKYGLNCAHAVYLTTLYQYSDGITATRLSKLCSKNKSDVSRMMAVMELKGLVRKERVNKNFYRALLKLTEEGQKAAEHVRERAHIAVMYAGQGIPEDKRENFYSVMEMVTANLKKLSKEGIPE